MPRKASIGFNEKDLTKGQLRKLNALRNSVGEEIGNKAFGEWLAAQDGDGRGAGAVDKNAARIANVVEPLIKEGKLSIPRGGYLLRRGRGRVIVERPAEHA